MAAPRRCAKRFRSASARRGWRWARWCTPGRAARALRLCLCAAWLKNPVRFAVSADLPLVAGYQAHKAASAHDSVFYGAIADTAPDAYGRRVIARDHAKRRPQLTALTELDYVLACRRPSP